MSALLLYIGVTALLLFAWSCYVQPLTRAAAIVLLLLPFCFTGRAILTGA